MINLLNMNQSHVLQVKKSKNVPRTVNVAETNELASATSTSPNSQAQLHTSQRDIQVSLEETLDLFVKVAVETAVKKQGVCTITML